MKKCFDVPLYEARVWVVVCDHVGQERAKWNCEFGEGADFDYPGLCSNNGRGFYTLFFKRRGLTVDVIAHEVFHLTHRIGEWCSLNFDADHHEATALLHGWLFRRVFKLTEKYLPGPKIKVDNRRGPRVSLPRMKDTSESPANLLEVWTETLARNIEKTIRNLKADGVVAVSANNLWATVTIPQYGGPAGTNGAYSARQIFDTLIAKNKFVSIR